jgi:hypothetical protein
VLLKQGHEDEAMLVLSKAANFHFISASNGIAAHNKKELFESNDLRNNNNNKNTANYSNNNNHNVLQDTLIGINQRVFENKNSLNNNNEETIISHNTIPLPIFKNTLLFDDIHAAIDLKSKVMRLCAKCNGKSQAVQEAEDIAGLCVAAFGWDSPETAEAYKQVLFFFVFFLFVY